jgi:tetratricopeptide (TPR) repeat protein
MIHFLAGLSLSVLLSACATTRGGSDVAQGRQAMLAGNYQAALGLFQDAEKVDPTYVYGTELRAGVLSYLGRTQYLTGNYAQARQTLEKAVSQHRSDDVARLYLGLTLYSLGDQKAALANIQRGMEGINNWLDYLNQNFRLEFGQDWDPGGTIRAGIKSDLDMISSGKINWAQLIADGEQLGIRIESEQDFYRVQNYRRYGSGN